MPRRRGRKLATSRSTPFTDNRRAASPAALRRFASRIIHVRRVRGAAARRRHGSQEQFDTFGKRLMPRLTDVGVELTIDRQVPEARP